MKVCQALRGFAGEEVFNFNHAAAEGAPAPLPLLCQDHKEPGMVDVLNRLCDFPGVHLGRCNRTLGRCKSLGHGWRLPF